ncbi:hypothetical protein NPIL_482451, partial [Nephila pilipes]
SYKVTYRTAKCKKPQNVAQEFILQPAADMMNKVFVKTLLDNDIDPCSADGRQRSALHFAAAGGHTEIGMF